MTYVETNNAVTDGPTGIDAIAFNARLITNKTVAKLILVAGAT